MTISDIQVVCFFILSLTFVSSEPTLRREDNYLAHHERTQAAVDELNDMVRYLFPIVPRHTQANWVTRFPIPLANVAEYLELENMHRQQQQQQQQQKKQPNPYTRSSPHYTRTHSKPQFIDDSVQDDIRFEKPEPFHSAREQAEHRPSDGHSVFKVVESVPNGAPLQLSGFDQSRTSGAGNSQIPKLDSEKSEDRKQRMSDKLIGYILSKIKNNSLAGKTRPEVTTPSLGKRGPECMRRCIQRGQLHPVQCHSLC